MRMLTAREASKHAAAAALADADGVLHIAHGYYTREYLRERGLILKRSQVKMPTVHVLERKEP